MSVHGSKAKRQLRQISWRLGLPLVGALMALTLWDGMLHWVDTSIERPLEFLARSTIFNRSPRVSERIKVLVFDDQVLGEIKRPNLLGDEWARLIASLNRAGPKAIIIDQIFAFDAAAASPVGNNSLVKALSDAGNVYAGAMVTPYETPGRHPVPSTKLRRTEEPRPLEIGLRQTKKSLNAFGPARSIASAFAGIGHIAYQSDGIVDLTVPVRDSYEIDHLLLSALERPEWKQRTMIIDFIEHKAFDQAIVSLLPFLSIAERNGTPSSVNPGDYVLIVPNFFTGNTDVDQSPIGRIHRSHAWISVLNSFVRNVYISEIGMAPLWSIAGVIVGAMVGIYVSGLWFWLALLLHTGCWVAMGLSIFALLAIQIPWAVPASFGIASSMLMYAIRSRASEKKVDVLKKTLKGTVPERQLSRYIQNPELVTMDSSEQILTLMFVDIAGFSQIAEKSSPRLMFERLQRILGDLTKIVHKHGGSIDKTLGDGLLCFFGYALDNQIGTINQADAAINCAIEMQRYNLEWNLRNIKSGEPVFPIRIGINTANVFVGYLGNEDRYDFTIIGNGVNFAQRLESACEPMSILMSGTTLDFSSNYRHRMDNVSIKRIKVKHHSELFVAVELNPLASEELPKAMVVEVFRRQQNLARKDQRWPMGTTQLPTVDTTYGRASLRDFSEGGGCLVLPLYLARGVQLELQVEGSNTEISERLKGLGIDGILAEVCWSKPTDTGFAHGIRFLNLHRQQNHLVFQTLREFLSGRHYKSIPIKKIS
jgi:class 3 adenylate cyclase